jgi:hypothetical protein
MHPDEHARAEQLHPGEEPHHDVLAVAVQPSSSSPELHRNTFHNPAVSVSPSAIPCATEEDTTLSASPLLPSATLSDVNPHVSRVQDTSPQSNGPRRRQQQQQPPPQQQHQQQQQQQQQMSINHQALIDEAVQAARLQVISY